VLPPGCLGTYPNVAGPVPPPFNEQQVGMLALLLPYVEQPAIDQVMRSGMPADYFSQSAIYNPWWTYPGPWTAAQYTVKIFLCPADSPDAAQQVFLSIQSYYSGTQLDETGGFMAQPTPPLGYTNYVGVGGYFGNINYNNGLAWTVPYQGMLCNRSQVSLQLVTSQDGLSNTLMVGEAIGDQDFGPRLYANAWMGAGTMITAPGLGDGPTSSWYTFDSKHTGVVNFCFGDGSVRPVNKNCDFNTFIFASGWADGQSYNPELLGS
jgi:prepilin-type processing-associated H-X9-DG protein